MLPLLKEAFLLDPQITYFNHGALGLCPIEVWEKGHEWEKRIESNPAHFFDRELAGEYRNVCDCLGAFLGVPGKDLVLVENATYAVNYVLQGLSFEKGSEILITDHEYGAYHRLWQRLENQLGIQVVRQHIPLPIESSEDVFQAFWSGVSSRTKLIFFSHIASRTALCFPAARICEEARKNGILTMVDGAHAPGQIDLDLGKLGADFYTGNCHKWLFAPRPCGFLYAAPEVQGKTKPLVISWGGESPQAGASSFRNDNVWLGTRDFTRMLSIPAAIEFFQKNDFANIREHCRTLARDAQTKIADLFSLPLLYPPAEGLYQQMVAMQLPQKDSTEVRERLALKYGIEVSTGLWHEISVIRLSIQCYNSTDDLERLCKALYEIF